MWRYHDGLIVEEHQVDGTQLLIYILLTLRHLCPESSCMTWLSLSTHYFLAGRRGRNPTVRRGFVTEPRLFPFRSCIPFGGQADSFACPCQLVLPLASPSCTLPWATPASPSSLEYSLPCSGFRPHRSP